MAVLTRLGATLAIVLAASCDFIPDPVALEDLAVRTMVHSLVRTGDDSVSVLVSRLYFQGTGTLARVSGAAVSIAAPERVLELVEDAPGAAPCFRRAFFGGREEDPPATAGEGCYVAAVPGGIDAVERYELRIELQDGTRIEGEAVAPAPPTIHAPAPGTAVVLESGEFEGGAVPAPFTLEWTTPAAGALIEIDAFAGGVFRAGGPVPGAGCHVDADLYDPDGGRTFDDDIPGSSTTVVLRNLGCSVPGDTVERVALNDWDSLHVRLRVTSYDSTYAGYYRRVIRGGGSVGEDDASAGLEGAAGVFAGVAVADRRITVIAPEDSAAAHP